MLFTQGQDASVSSKCENCSWPPRFTMETFGIITNEWSEWFRLQMHDTRGSANEPLFDVNTLRTKADTILPRNRPHQNPRPELCFFEKRADASIRRV